MFPTVIRKITKEFLIIFIYTLVSYQSPEAAPFMAIAFTVQFDDLPATFTFLVGSS